MCSSVKEESTNWEHHACSVDAGLLMVDVAMKATNRTVRSSTVAEGAGVL